MHVNSLSGAVRVDPAQYGLVLGLSCGHDLPTCSAKERAQAEQYRNEFITVVQGWCLVACMFWNAFVQ